MAKNTGGGSRVGGAHHRPLTRAEKRSISYAFAYWFVACLLFIAILAGLVILLAP